MLNSENPIGVFDSGVGGLTVAGAIRKVLPNEQIVYFGDTAHLPYGDKSSSAIKHYSTKISEFLIQKKCKAIVIACNSASSNAMHEVKQTVGNKAIVVDVINPVVDFVTEKSEYKKLGVIGTKSTINSKTYQEKISRKNKNLSVAALATTLFAPMIEEGFVFDDISNAIIRSYLSDEKLKGIDSVILACTHYPVIKNQIRKYYNFKTPVIDSSLIVANFLKSELELNGLISSKQCNQHLFYVSDYTEYFEHIAEMFFEEKIRLKHYDIWKM